MINANSKTMTPDGKTKLEVGIGATLSVGSDRYPYTVIDFNKTGKTLTVVRDEYEADKGAGYDYFSNQVYKYTPGDPKHAETARWSKIRNCYRLGSSRLSVGTREAYSDPSF